MISFIWRVSPYISNRPDCDLKCILLASIVPAVTLSAATLSIMADFINALDIVVLSAFKTIVCVLPAVTLPASRVLTRSRSTSSTCTSALVAYRSCTYSLDT